MLLGNLMMEAGCQGTNLVMRRLELLVPSPDLQRGERLEAEFNYQWPVI